ncbi:MAG TPA: lipopolysaccharide heptosyltransferase I [Terriglobia bacterium]|nr:lipopolysaccharide heptosyltransferase I [Terriglobia bacterium]
MRFLLIRLSSIGDIVHALPAVAALGDAFPEAEITWVVEERFAGLLEGNPFVRQLVRIDTLSWRGRWTSIATMRQAARSLRELRERTFDAAIDFQGLLKSALIAWLSRSRERVGLQRRWLREPAAGAFYTERVTAWGRRHAIEENLALVEHFGAPPTPPARWKFPLPRTAADDCVVSERLASLDAADCVIVNPGGGWATKRWAPENYAELIRTLETEVPWRILLTGSPPEEALIQDVLRRSESKRAVYFPSTLVQFIALARRARLFVGGDTGPLHLAAAVGTPIVGIYGPTDPARNGPFAAADIALSAAAPDDSAARFRVAADLRGISVEAVRAAVHQRLRAAYG